MQPYKLVICVCFLLHFGSSFSEVQVHGHEDVKKLIEAKQRFTLNLYKQLNGGNIVFSPCSINLDLLMLYFGSGGSTKKEIAKTLCIDETKIPDSKILELYAKLVETLSNLPKKIYTLRFGNAAFVQKSFNIQKPFQDLIKRNFKSDMISVDFANSGKLAIETINNFVSKSTKGLLPEIYKQPLSKTTKLLLVSSFYYEASWEYRFNPSSTRKDVFRSGTRIKQTEFMIQEKTNVNFTISKELDSQLMELKFQGGKMSMVIILPKSGTDLKLLKERLSMETLIPALNSLKPRRVAIKIPKLQLSGKHVLGGPLHKLGMVSAFDPKKANLSVIAGTRRLFLSKDMIHEARFVMDEHGGNIAGRKASGTKTLEHTYTVTLFIADHPFLVLIRCVSSGAFVFFGEVTTV